ncbi:hypothetical protein [Natronococcus pandeyae]|nr:hypothetical protein [Natronococcus pandeyae]
MIWVVQPFRFREQRYTIVRFALAAIVAVLGALLYLELVTLLLEYAG